MIRFFSYLTLTLLALVALFPIVTMVITSFLQNGDLFTAIRSSSRFVLTWDNYKAAWTQGNFGRYFINSSIVCVIVTLLNLLFDSMVAYALARRVFFGKKVIMWLLVIRLMLPAAILMIPLFLIVRDMGIYDTYAALILPVSTEAFGIFLLRQYILGLPVALEEAAKIEGASDWRIFFTIVMPLCKPALAVVAIHSVLINWNAYIYPLILTSSNSMRTLPLGIAFYQSSKTNMTMPNLMAASVLSALPLLIAFLFFNKQIIGGLTQGSVKE